MYSRVSLILSLIWLLPTAVTAADTYDVLIYGATPGGIAAALAAAESGRQVLLVEPTAHLGGLVTSGLSHTDFHSFESLTGAYLDFSTRVEQHYRNEYGPDSRQVHDCFHGTFAEPKVNSLVFAQMLAEFKNLDVKTSLRLSDVVLVAEGDFQKILAAKFVNEGAEAVDIAALIFIDATYEGDLLAAAGVAAHVGREGRSVYGESLAPAESDGQLQAYNFRFVMTRNPENRVAPEAPVGYRREDFIEIVPILASGQIKRVFDYPSECIFKAQTPPLPNGKYDINDVSRGIIRLSLPGQNLDWPTGDVASRQRIYAEHLRDQVGLLYFLQHDSDVPEKFRAEALEWGWCADEFIETSHLPPQLYVREARRMVGQHVFVQQDSEHAPGDARAMFHATSIAMGDYGNNCHGTFHEGSRFGGKHTGELYNPVPPYQIPYGVLVPRNVSNLLVPVAASSSHIGFCALRLEPIWMSLGQAAGHAAVQAIGRQVPVQQVDVAQLQRRLHAVGSATIYVSDVLPGHPDFVRVQWWGSLGGLHGLNPSPEKPGQRGIKLHGQYFTANPGHAAELDRQLSPELWKRWSALAESLRVTVPQSPEITRREFIRHVFGQVASEK